VKAAIAKQHLGEQTVSRPQDRLLENLRSAADSMVDRIPLLGQSNTTYGVLHPFKLIEWMNWLR